MADYMQELGDKSLKWTESAITAVTKKSAASFWAKFKRHLSTASEPLLRRDMGERYLSAEAHGGGASLWFIATAVALAVPELRSGAAILFGMANWYRAEHLFSHWLPTLVVGGAFSYFHIKFGLQSRALMEQYRAAGTPYHTQSRGIPRWGDNQRFAIIGIAAALLLFDFPAGILFIASIGMSAKLGREQQAAIRSRYLDALDQRIESEYLEDAILGKCPAEITQLHQPLPAHMNADLRNNIAAAAVGKPVTIMAKGPRSGDAPAPAENSGGKGGGHSGVSRQPLGIPREGAPSVAKPEPLETPKPQPNPEPQPPESFTAESPATPAPAIPQFVNPRPGTPGMATLKPIEPVQPQPEAQRQKTCFSAPAEPTAKATPSATLASQPTAKSNKKLFTGLIIVLAVAIAAGSIVHFWPAKSKQLSGQVATRTENSPSVPAEAIPNSPPPAAPVAQPQPVQSVAAPATNAATVAPTDPQAQKLKERQQALEQITVELTNRITQLANYTAECEAKLGTYDGKLASFGPDDRAVLKHNSDSARQTIEKNLKNQAESLKGYQTVFGALLARPQADPQIAMQSLSDYFARMDKIRGECTGIFASLDKDFTPDSH
jgi:flagellar basal body-associated protein FliL